MSELSQLPSALQNIVWLATAKGRYIPRLWFAHVPCHDWADARRDLESLGADYFALPIPSQNLMQVYAGGPIEERYTLLTETPIRCSIIVASAVMAAGIELHGVANAEISGGWRAILDLATFFDQPTATAETQGAGG